ncbi:hypothetical protein HYPSUDRAFT_211239 [Hypholoma sublateritium FD-334 SS-4]|uniref:Uncharacterized protein n=1 Tax=Hypholoma sublateritium (strain FD-334 SS-4) TaxID=945553 RepID=A0A0D2MZ07_HYPSF|nr:hypothetical protein HYPSUDRAFT_211239 [Hypholoma sublateritium FD-334 SS-4]
MLGQLPKRPCKRSLRMWCTRWYLPLLLLPLPTAPPYFLLLFLVSITIHAKPCFYCIILLTTLFISTCYWQPFPVDTPLSTPWAENITTFAAALNATLMANYSRPLPPAIRAVDRCWCDLGAGGLFEPYNISQWEHNTVRRLVKDLERDARIEDARLQKEHEARKREERDTFFLTKFEDYEPEAAATALPQASVEAPAPALSFWARLKLLTDKAMAPSFSVSTPPPPSPPIVATEPPVQEVKRVTPPPAPAHVQDPLIRTEYDLRPYGLGMIVDLRWAR